MIIVTQYDKDQWSRMAQAAYREGHNEIGHRYSVAASIPAYTQLTVERFDALNIAWRRWLVFNEWPTV